METLKLKYDYECDLYDYDSANNNLLDKIADLLTTEIQDSGLYIELLNKSPHEYRGNAAIVTKVDNYIILRNQYESTKYLIPNEKFKILMDQWHKACIDKRHEITISLDNNKNFTITYDSKKDESAKNIKQVTQTYESNNAEPIFSSSKIDVQENYFEIEPIDDKLFAFPPEDNATLNLFANFLISEVPLSDYKEKLTQPPYEYYDDRYYLAIVEDRILIYDKTEEIKALPRYDKFLDLMRKWQITIKEKSELYRVYLANDYDFKVYFLEEVK